MTPGWRHAARLLHHAAAASLLAAAAWHGCRAGWIEVKAHLAQHLVRRAWRAAQAGGETARPWRWADTRPVARLSVPGRDVDVIVLAGASGRTLAFGPGHVAGTPLPGARGNSVIAGHRDTHFAFLRGLRRGDALAVQRADGDTVEYRVAGTAVVDRLATEVMADAGDTRLTLVTCYPFDALRSGGPLRYVVTAVREPGTRADEGRQSRPARRLRTSSA